jgi:diaminopimelate decarboxylase
MSKKIYISGMHSGQSPCPGVGIARSIRKAFPGLTLVGVDHWQGSSGLHDSSIDEILILPQWHQIDDERHVRQLHEIMDSGNLWISSLDMEVRWLSEKFGPHAHLLAPGGSALLQTEKPAVKAFSELGFLVPEYISASLPDSEIHRFLRHSSWQCWLKSPFHDAKRVSSWGAFDRSRHAMAKSWRTSELFVQRNVFGNEESIAFSAYRGELLGAVHMEKRLLTPEGKTWAGRVTPASAEFVSVFKEVIRALDWSGGGEIEYVRDPDGKKWIIECNPRFPAWIFGAALSGLNLPARMISRIWDLPLLENISRFPFFTRVVQEIPAKESVGLPLPADPTSMGWVGDGKKGKGGASVALSLPTLKDSTGQGEDGEEDETIEAERIEKGIEPLSPAFQAEIASVSTSFAHSGGDTPARIHLEQWTNSRFETLAKNVGASRARRPEIRIGYSVKTSPTADHLRKAMKHGFFSECISQMEVRRALEFGFKPSDVILNGPGKFWPLTVPHTMGLHMLFCDSVEEFDRVIEMPGIAQALGFRMRLPKLHSRFGNPLDQFENFQGIVERVRKIKGRADLGFHFHMPSWAIGVESWMEALRSLIVWCQTMETLTEVPVRRLDLGGGFFPSDLENLNFKFIQETVGESLKNVQGIYLEPGRSLTQDGEVLVSRVLDVRKSKAGKNSEIVVDACIAELPLVQAFTHRIFYQGELLKKGACKVLGRICMEDDILSNGLAIPESVKIGDLLVFGDAGGYERTMSYDFGRG